MAVYIIGIIVPVVCQLILNNINKNKGKLLEKVFVLFIFLYYLFLAIFRDVSVGTDLPIYLRRVYLIKQFDWLALPTLNTRWGFEYGYLVFTKLISIISTEPRVYIVITGGFIILAFYYAIKRWSKQPCLSWAFFNLFMYFSASLNIIRLFLAVSILFFAIPAIHDKKPIKYIILVLIASSFHTTALLFFPIYWISKIKINWKYIITIIITSITVFFFSSKILLVVWRLFNETYEQRYFDDIGTGSGNGILLLLVFVFLYCYFHKKELLEDDEYNYLWMHLLLVSIVLVMFSLRLMIAARLMWYTKISLIFILPNMMSCRKKEKESKVMDYVFLLLVLGATIYYYVQMMGTDTAGVVPYAFCF